METLFIFVIVALFIQIALFYMAKQKKKLTVTKDSILEKYNIKTKGDAFKLINSHQIPEVDRIKIEKFYQEGF